LFPIDEDHDPGPRFQDLVNALPRVDVPSDVIDEDLAPDCCDIAEEEAIPVLPRGHDILSVVDGDVTDCVKLFPDCLDVLFCDEPRACCECCIVSCDGREWLVDFLNEFAWETFVVSSKIEDAKAIVTRDDKRVRSLGFEEEWDLIKVR